MSHLQDITLLIINKLSTPLFPGETTAILSYHVKQGVAPRGNGEGTVQEMNDTSTWIQTGKRWQCAMHTKTPAEAKKPAH